MQSKQVIVLAAILVAVAAFVLPLTASATSWSAPFAIGGGDAKVGGTAIDSTGRIHFVWWDPGGTNIQYTNCDVNGSCASPTTLSGAGCYYPSIAIDPQNRPNVVFECKDSSTGYKVYFRRLEANGWSATPVSSESYSELSDVAVGKQGIIHVVYQSKVGTTAYIYYSESSNGSTFSRPVSLDKMSVPADFPAAAESANESIKGPAGSQLASGLYPRVAVDSADRAHVVWNAPSPYGIRYVYELPGGGFSGVISVSNSHKDQTPDIAVNNQNVVGIVWTKYLEQRISVAEYYNGAYVNRWDNTDGGTAVSFWPRISADCAGYFHFVFQGAYSATSPNWDIYHTQFNPTNGAFGSRDTIASTGYQEQTPYVESTNVAAIIYANTSLKIADASTANLGISCNSAVPTPTNTVIPTRTPRPPTPVPSDSNLYHIPDTHEYVHYEGTAWTKHRSQKATDGEFKLCYNGTNCPDNSAVWVSFYGYKVEWETAYSNRFGVANVFIDNQLVERVSLCDGHTIALDQPVTAPSTVSAAPPHRKFRTRGYVVGNTNAWHVIEIGIMKRHSDCGDGTSSTNNLFIVDGFNVITYKQDTSQPAIPVRATR